MNANPDYPYIAINDMPKLDNLQRQFPDFYREKPVLVSWPAEVPPQGGRDGGAG